MLRTHPIPNPSHSEPITFKRHGIYPPDCHPTPRDGTNETGSWDGISHIFWPSTFERKKVVVHIRGLNNITENDVYFMPLQSNIISAVQNAS